MKSEEQPLQHEPGDVLAGTPSTKTTGISMPKRSST